MPESLLPVKGKDPIEQVVDHRSCELVASNLASFPNKRFRSSPHIQVTDKNLYDTSAQRQPQPNGPLDLRLGTTSKTDVCETCGRDQNGCNGHWGYIKLHAPCFHIGYLSFTLEVLNQVCKTCSRILLPEFERRNYLKALRRPGLDQHQRKLTLKKVQIDCRKNKKCPHCTATNGPVRKVPHHACKVVHLKFEHFNKSTAKKKEPPEDKKMFDKAFQSYLKQNPEMDRHVRKAIEDLLPIKVWNIFHHIVTEDCELLGIDLNLGRPESYLWTYIPVPPTLH